MAKVVIAGCSDCQYFPRVELLGDRMMKNLPSFHVHKIVKTPGEWTAWLSQMCQQQGWAHETSPLIWRELVDRGGKPLLIGGANEFQEYVKEYYGHQSSLSSQDMLLIGQENFQTKQEIDIEEAHYRELSKPIYVCITAAESLVCYSLISYLVSGEVFEPSTTISLRLFTSDPKQVPVVRTAAMDAMDLCSPQLRDVEVVESTVEAFKNCIVVIMLDELLQQNHEDFDDWVWRNYKHFAEYGHEINEGAMKNVLVLVAGSELVNFNTMVVINSAYNIPRRNIVGLSREIENRAKAVVARRLDVATCQIADLVVWGNIYRERLIDTNQTKVFGFEGAITGPPFYWEPMVERLHDHEWLDKEFLPLVDARRSEVEQALQQTTCASAAMAIATTLNHLMNGSPKGRIFSLAVCSEGWYDVPDGLVFSFPVIMHPNWQWTVVQDMQLTTVSEIKLIDCTKDLVKEAEVIYPAFHGYLEFLEQEQAKLRRRPGSNLVQDLESERSHSTSAKGAPDDLGADKFNNLLHV